MAKSSARMRARALRKSGMSVATIAARLDVAKSSVSLWCRDIVLSSGQLQKLRAHSQAGAQLGRLRGAITNHAKRVSRLRSAYADAERVIGSLSSRDLWLLGIGLYWAEGNKKGQTTFGFANADARMIMVLITWLHRCLGVQKSDLIFRVVINKIHRHRERRVVQYWSRMVQVPTKAFRSTTFTKNVVKKRYENHDEHFGTLHVRVRNGSHHLFRVLGCIARCTGIDEEAFLKETGAGRALFVSRESL